jgi:hypothetical protein
MAKKTFKGSECNLQLITSISGVMIVKVFDKLTKELIDQKYFVEVDHNFTDFFDDHGVDCNKAILYLNNNQL